MPSSSGTAGPTHPSRTPFPCCLATVSWYSWGMGEDLVRAGNEDVPVDAVDVIDTTAGEAADAAVTDPVAAAAADHARLVAEVETAAADVETASTAGGLVPAGGDLDATSMKAALVEARTTLARKQSDLAAASKRLRSELDRQMSAANAALAPLKAQMARLSDGIDAVNLYLGRDEEIVTLAEGSPAPAGTPIVVRQTVLSMDQECAVAAEAGGIDASDVEAFDAWVTADPAHLDQVLPEPRGVVALMPRVTDIDYGDPWTNTRMSEANQVTYLLIRNGDCVYSTTAGFSVGARLIPAADEFTRFFRTERRGPDGTIETVDLEPGSTAWARAEAAADARTRHFMKVAMLLQGLLDRTAVLAPLPAPNVSFLHPDSYDAGHVVIVADGDHALGDGAERFRDWQSRLCAQLDVGMRIVGAFGGTAWRDANERDRGHSRLRPETAYPPPTGVLLRIEDRDRRTGELVVRYDRTDTRYGYEHGDTGAWGEWPYKTRASARIRPTDTFVVPFDVADRADMERFLGRRSDRADYLTMIPLLRAAIAAKDEEAAAETDFRQLLTAQIATRNNTPIDEAADDLDALIAWWKTTNRHHRPLDGGDPASQTAAIDAIVTEAARRAADRHRSETEADHEAAVAARLLADHPDLMLIARRPDGSFYAAAPQRPGEPCYVRAVTVTPAGRNTTTTDWQTLPRRWRHWRALHTTATLDTWDHTTRPRDHLTGPDRDRLAADAVAWHHQHFPRLTPIAVTFDPWRGHDYSSDNRRVTITAVDLEPRPGDPTRQDQAATYTSRLWWKPDTHQPHLATYDRPSHPSASTISAFFLREHLPPNPTSRQTAEAALNKITTPAWWTADPGTLTAAAGTLTAGLDHNHQADTLTTAARSAANHITAAWDTATEAAAYQRFLDDYTDPDLWEGHRKTLRLDRCPDTDTIHAIAHAYAARDGHIDNLTGRTVADTLTEALAAGLDLDNRHHTTPTVDDLDPTVANTTWP